MAGSKCPLSAKTCKNPTPWGCCDSSVSDWKAITWWMMKIVPREMFSISTIQLGQIMEPLIPPVNFWPLYRNLRSPTGIRTAPLSFIAGNLHEKILPPYLMGNLSMCQKHEIRFSGTTCGTGWQGIFNLTSKVFLRSFVGWNSGLLNKRNATLGFDFLMELNWHKGW